MFYRERINNLEEYIFQMESDFKDVRERFDKDELDIGTLVDDMSNTKASLNLAYKKINELNETIMSLLERVEILEERSTSDKAIADGINQLMSYNPYDHVKGDY